MMKYLQKLGKALMLPVAVLPICGILMGIGYALAPAVMGAEGATSGAAYTIGFLLIKAGGALIDNMAWLFAIGAAVGLADNDGTAGLAGLVSFLMMQQLLNPGVVGMVRHLEEGTATYIAFQKVAGNSFIGILAAVVGAACYNKFKDTQMPDWLAFFSGKRFVAIATGLISILVSVVLLFVWPVIFDALVAIGTAIAGMGGIGAGIYAFLNRLLIPTGLHHALNNVFWFNLANINDIGKFWGSADPASGAVIATGGFHPFGVYVTGIYQAGFFPIMMFGLPAGALAIYKNAKPENKKATGSLMLAGALAAFLTGVTEPLEFSFMFAAFPLYVVHALLTAISVFIAASFQWIAGFNFSAGFIDWFLSLKVPAAHMPWMLIVQGLVFAVIYYFVFDFMIKKFNMKTPGRGDDDNDDASSAAFDTATSSTGDKYADLAGKLYAALGGHDNITEIENCITRLRMGVVDSSKVDVDAIRKTGVPGVKVIDKKNVQIIVGTQVQAVADALSALYGKPVIGGGSPKA